jgi:type I restriction enzyme, S subunit
MSETVPEGWYVYSLDELGQISGGGTPASDVQSYWGGDVHWATPAEITTLNGRYISSTTRTITEEGLKNSSAKVHPVGTILITSRASIGYPAINKVPMATNQGFQSLRPNEKLDVEYGYQALIRHQGDLERLSAGSTFLEISSKEIKKFKINLPPLPEQKKIASILTSVDEVIENTQRQIDKLQELKKATMNELLTKGIGHTEFKDSELGRIPKSWEVKYFKEICSVITKGTTPSSLGFQFSKSGINFVKVESIISDGVIDANKFSFVSDKVHQKMTRSQIYENDILLTIAGATVGKLAIAENKFLPANTNQALSIIRIVNKKALHKFVFYWLQTDWIKNFIASSQTVGAQPNISLSQIAGFPFPSSSIYEQSEIVSVLESVDQRIYLEEQKLSHTQSLKKSLMQDLLTGKVRVQV